MTKSILKKIGASGENDAAAHLVDSGFEIIKKNFRAGKLAEIDIIAKKGNLVVFVEVKKRNSDSQFGGALRSIGQGKKRKIKTAASKFLMENQLFNSKEFMFRYDMIAIEDGKTVHLEDIFR